MVATAAEPPADLPRLEKLLLAVSVQQWRTLHGRTLLYCDSPYARILDGAGMLELFDEVDTETLDATDALDIDATVFWSFGRLLAVRAATVPFVSLDCDLVVWRSLTDVLAPGRIVVTHWESTDPSPWYPSPRELTTPPGYQWKAWMQATTDAANVSLLYLGDERVRDRYVTEAIRFAADNPARARPDLGVAPELLFAEQRLLRLVAQRDRPHDRPGHRGSVVTGTRPIHRPRSAVRRMGPLRVRGQRAGITHAWFHKALLPAEHPRRRRLIDDLTDVLRSVQPAVAERIGDDVAR